MFYTHVDSPVGPLLLAGDDNALKVISFPSGSKCITPEPDWTARAEPFADASAQLAAYFAGELTEFDLELAPQGTPFQRSVWDELLRIPYGETRSYGELAKSIGRPKASRAVGAANGSNPLSIVVPCHRVIGSTGKLTGFGGGIETKATLLGLEQRVSGTAGEQRRFSF